MPAPSTIAATPAYQRHRPEQTALFSIVAEHYPRFVQEIERAGGHLPGFVRQEFEDYLQPTAFQVRLKFPADESGQVFAVAGQFGLELRPVFLDDLVE